MRVQQSAPDDTFRQNLRNGVGQIEAGVANCEMDLQEVVRQFDFLDECGSVEQVAIGKVDIARQAVKLEQIMPRLQAFLEKLESVAGTRAMVVAKTPPVFRR